MIGKIEWIRIGLIYIKVLKTEFDYGLNTRGKEKEDLKDNVKFLGQKQQ